VTTHPLRGRTAIVGIAATALTDAEAAMFAADPPAGVILFARNIDHPAQLAALVAALRRVLPAEAVLMVDQEGGRVARLRPPHWPALPPAGAIATMLSSRNTTSYPSASSQNSANRSGW